MRWWAGCAIALAVFASSCTSEPEPAASPPGLDPLPGVALTEDWARLGHGYQVDVAIVLWSADDVLKVPLTALFRQDEAWAVFVRENGDAVVRTVEVGNRTDAEAEILGGLSVGEEIVVYPSEGIAPGVSIAGRDGS